MQNDTQECIVISTVFSRGPLKIKIRGRERDKSIDLGVIQNTNGLRFEICVELLMCKMEGRERTRGEGSQDL